MGKLWMKFWVWTKAIVFLLVLFYVFAFVVFNSKNDARVWFFPYREVATTSLALAVFAFLGGGISTILFRTTVTTLRQLREMKERRREERLHRELEAYKARAGLVSPVHEAPKPAVVAPAPAVQTYSPDENAGET